MNIKFLSQLSLKEDQADNEEIRQRIASGAEISATNMFILIFAILIACIGLNMDSTAVVIGAMLISPLMGILISLAYGIANHDVQWIKKALATFLFQIAVSIMTSTIYFLLSPINVFSGELAARTHPNIFDVLIGSLGGAAAIIANTRKNLISNVIPGTAIATALMPPLCTIGYCIASRNWISALGASYLFLINSIFICFSALLGLHFMKVTHNKDLLKSAKSRIIVAVMLIIVIIPSCFLAWQTVSESTAQKNFKSFVKNEFNFNNTQVVTSDIDIPNKTIEISLIGSTISDKEISYIKHNLAKYDLNTYKLDIIQTYVDAGVSKDELENYINKDTSRQKIDADQLSDLKETKLLLNVYQKKEVMEKDFLQELPIVFPEVLTCGFSEMYETEQEESEDTLVLVLKEPLTPEKEKQLLEWAEHKLDKKIRILKTVQE